jgi:ATP-dependent exoDNAse (exonuclease V) beta subunit
MPLVVVPLKMNSAIIEIAQQELIRELTTGQRRRRGQSIVARKIRVTIIGIVDLLLETKNGITLVDFKTSASATAMCELQHELQLTAYSYIVREVFGCAEEALEIRQLVL